MPRRTVLFAAALLAFLAGGWSQAHAQQAWNSATLTWTTPGDDSLSGTATQFDIRYSNSPITAANFSGATRWTTGVPAPAAAGTRQSTVVTGLTPTATYYFAMKTVDDAGNWSGLSNVASKTLPAAPDTLRPAALALSVSTRTDTSATLAWSAVGDDSLTGTATSYDIRYSTSPITAANFASATPVSGAPAPAAPGTAQSVVVHALARETTYYFAARVADEAGNASALSNVASTTTTDTLAPAAINNLTVGLVLTRLTAAAAPRPARR